MCNRLVSAHTWTEKVQVLQYGHQQIYIYEIEMVNPFSTYIEFYVPTHVTCKTWTFYPEYGLVGGVTDVELRLHDAPALTYVPNNVTCRSTHLNFLQRKTQENHIILYSNNTKLALDQLM